MFTNGCNVDHLSPSETTGSFERVYRDGFSETDFAQKQGIILGILAVTDTTVLPSDQSSVSPQLRPCFCYCLDTNWLLQAVPTGCWDIAQSTEDTSVTEATLRFAALCMASKKFSKLSVSFTFGYLCVCVCDTLCLQRWGLGEHMFRTVAILN